MNLSVVTVCFNADKTIEKTIKSVLNQTKAVYEYIVVDGLSTDRTMDIVKSFIGDFQKKGIRFIYQSEKDSGISNAFNKGIRQASGDYIALLNADDEMLPRTSEILSKMSKIDADIIYGNCIWVDKENKIEYVSKPKSHDMKKLLYSMIIIHPSTFVKKEAYARVGVFDESFKYCMDAELLYRMYRKQASFYYIDESLTRFKSGGVSDKHAAAVYREVSRIAYKYGEPKFKIELIRLYKLIRYKVITLVKRTRLFRRIKRAKKLDCS